MVMALRDIHGNCAVGSHRGAGEVQAHRFFRQTRWDALLEQVWRVAGAVVVVVAAAE